MRVGNVFRIGGNHPRFHPEAHAFRCQHVNAHVVFHFFRTRFRHVQVAAVARHQADIAARQFVDVRRAETFHVGADGLQHGGCGFNVGRIGAARVFTQVIQHQREHFAGRVPQRDAALFQFVGVFGFEQQIPAVFRQFSAQDFFAFGGNRQCVHAGEVWHGVLVAWVGLFQQFQQCGVDVFVVRNQVAVDFLISTCFDLAGQECDAGNAQIVAGFAGEHFGFKRFVVFVQIVGQIQIVGFFEVFNGAFVHIVRPVVDIQLVGLRQVARRCAGCRRICRIVCGSVFSLLGAGCQNHQHEGA